MAQPLSAVSEHAVSAFAFESCQYHSRLYPGDDVSDKHVVRVLTARSRRAALSAKEYLRLLLTQLRIEERDTLRRCMNRYAPTVDVNSPYDWEYTKGVYVILLFG
jgi:hypothetical protein